MAVVKVAGNDAHDLLQHCFTNDLDACLGKSRKPIREGRCVYGAFLNPRGEVVDDSIVYKRADEQYMVVVNAGMGAEIAAHLEAHRGERDARICDMTDRLGKIDIQGPLSAKILADVLADAQKVFDAMPYFSFKGSFDERFAVSTTVRLKGGAPILLSRTGYTGEFGFELFMAADRTLEAWEAIVNAGTFRGLAACGLAARDSLRAGAGLPLSHQDIGHWPFINHPWPFALPFNTEASGFTKAFIGDQALLNPDPLAYTLIYAGQDLRKVNTHDPAVVIDSKDQQIGTVLTCASDMGIDRVNGRIVSLASVNKPQDFKPRGLSCGFIKVNQNLHAGEQVQLKDNRRTLTVAIVENIRPDRTARRKLQEML